MRAAADFAAQSDPSRNRFFRRIWEEPAPIDPEPRREITEAERFGEIALDLLAKRRGRT